MKTLLLEMFLKRNLAQKPAIFIFIVQLWDVEAQKRVRSMSGHSARVGCLSWNSYILSR